MSEPKLISPMLDNFEMGGPISDHHGVKCCPAMRKNTDEKYIVKIISVPASQTKLDALLLTGAYPDKASALVYFKDLADEILAEKRILDDLAQLEGFVPYEDCQIVPMEDGNGYDVYLLSAYQKTLERSLSRKALTQLGAVNLGLDICAALAVCRRSGYMFVDLKPSNIYISEDKSFKIGDLGFVKLSGLKYASLPDKYRNAYNAPEVEDAFAALSNTMDIYSAGLILYQVFNGGILPFTGEHAPNEIFDAPAYADEEMSQIILKACHPDSAERWQDPVQMGQAIVSYMQRNGVNDTPLTAEFFGGAEAPAEDVPPESTEDTEQAAESAATVADEIVSDQEESAPEEEAEAIPTQEQEEITAAEADTDANVSPPNEEVTEDLCEEQPEDADCSEDAAETPAAVPEAAIPDPEDEEESAEADADAESDDEEYDNLSFLDEMMEGIDLTSDADPDDYSGVTDEVSEILGQVDALAALEVPEPVVAPEPIEVKIPDPIPADETEEPPADEDASDEEASEEPQDVAEVSEDAEDEEEEEEELPYIPKKKRPGLTWTIIILIILGLAAGGYYFYTNYYLQPVHSLELSGSEDVLQVQVEAGVEDSMLTVVCSDPHGNNIPAPVVDGTAVFTGLTPDTAYTVSVEVSGFHQLTGTTTKVYSTPIQTQIAQINIVTGADDGSVILSFSVEGPDSDQWNVIYSAEGEAERVTTFPAHMVTLAGLTVGKEYSFRLEPVDDIYLSGTTEATYVARKLICAENLRISACADGVLTAQWDVPAEESITQWTVRCYSDDGMYDETITTAETVAIFENIDDTKAHTVEVTAEYMSVNQRTQVNSNSVTITDFSVESADAVAIKLAWKSNRDIPDGGWLVQYTVNGVTAASAVTTDANSVEIPAVPGGDYVFNITDAAGNAALGGPFTHVQSPAEELDAFSVKKSDLNLRLCNTPSLSSWTYKDVADTDYVNTFSAGQKVSAVISSSADVKSTSTKVLTTFAIFDESDSLISFSHKTQNWKSMWNDNYCEFDIPGIPADTGTYKLIVYFDGAEAGSQKFEITA